MAADPRDEMALLRRRLDALEAEAARRSRDAHDGGIRAFVGKVYDGGNMPAEVPGMFLVHPVSLDGEESVAAPPTIAETGEPGVVVLVLGPAVPAVGDLLRCRLVPRGYWVAERGGLVTPVIPPATGGVALHLVSACGCGTGRPSLSVVTVDDGVPGPVATTMYLRFGGTITGGTFRFGTGFVTTPLITYSADPASRVAAIQAALDATAGVPVGAFVVSAGLSARDDYIVLAGGLGLALVAADLTGPGHSLTLDVGRTTGTLTTAVRELQELVVDGAPSGGTFRLAFGGQTTAPIAWSGTGTTLDANITAALTALSNIGAGNASTRDRVVRFEGPLTGVDVPEMTVAENLLTGTGRDVLAGATVTLKKDGVTVGAGTTDAHGNVRIPIAGNYGPGYTVAVAHADFYAADRITPVGAATSAGVLTPAGTLTYLSTSRNRTLRLDLYPREVPFLWRFYNGDTPDPDDRIAGVAITMTGQAGTQAAGWSASGTTDSAGEFRGTIPGINPDAVAPAVSNAGFAWSYLFPPGFPLATLPVTGAYDVAGAPCGLYWEGGTFYGIGLLACAGAFVPIRITTGTTSGSPSSPGPTVPLPGVLVTVPGGDPPSGISGPDGGFTSTVPGPTPAVPPSGSDPGLPEIPGEAPWTATLPPYIPDSGTAPVVGSGPVDVDAVLPVPSDRYPYPPTYVDPIPTELPAVLSPDPIFGPVGGTTVPLPLVTPDPPTWGNCLDTPEGGGTPNPDPDSDGEWLGWGSVRIWVAHVAPGGVETAPTIEATAAVSPTPGCADPEPATSFPVVTGTTVAPVAVVVATPPPEPPPEPPAPTPTITIGTPNCRDTPSFPATVSVTVGPEAVFGPFAGTVHDVPKVSDRPLVYEMLTTGATPWLRIRVAYEFGTDNLPKGVVTTQVLYANHAEQAVMSQISGDAMCPAIDYAAQSTTPPATATVLEPTGPGATCPMVVGRYFEDVSPPSKFIHLLIYDSTGTTLLEEVAPTAAAGLRGYRALSALTDFGTKSLYVFTAVVSDLPSDVAYHIRAYSSPRAGHATGDGPRTLLGEETVTLRCLRLALRGCGFDGPNIGVITDDIGQTSDVSNDFGLGDYANSLLGGATLIVRDGATIVASGTADSQGFAYFDFVPDVATTYDLEILPPDASGYPDHHFGIVSALNLDPPSDAEVFADDPDIGISSVDNFTIILDKGLDVLVRGCGCGVDGAAVMVQRTSLDDPGTILETLDGTTDAAGIVHFSRQMVLGRYVITPTKSPLEPWPTGPAVVTVSNTNSNCLLVSTSVGVHNNPVDLAGATITNPNPALPNLPWPSRYCFGGSPPRCEDLMPSSVFLTLGTETFWDGDDPTHTFKGATLEVPRPSDPGSYFYGDENYRQMFGWFTPTAGGGPYIAIYPTNSDHGGVAGTFGPTLLQIDVEWPNFGTCNEPVGDVHASFTGGGGYFTETWLRQDSGSSACPLAYHAAQRSGYPTATATVSD